MAGVTGTLDPHATHEPCLSDGDTDCMLEAPLMALNPNSIDPLKMLESQTLLGVKGSIVERGQWNLSNTFPGAGYFSGVKNTPTAGSIRNGHTVLGVEGQFPSAAHRLNGYAVGVTDLTDANLNSALQSSNAFEWWNSMGEHFRSNGDADHFLPENIKDGITLFGVEGVFQGESSVDPWDLRSGVQVGDTVGKLKVTCRNMVGTYDNTSAPAGSGIDIWDTIDDYNNDGVFPVANPWNDHSHLASRSKKCKCLIAG